MEAENVNKRSQVTEPADAFPAAMAVFGTFYSMAMRAYVACSTDCSQNNLKELSRTLTLCLEQMLEEPCLAFIATNGVIVDDFKRYVSNQISTFLTDPVRSIGLVQGLQLQTKPTDTEFGFEQLYRLSYLKSLKKECDKATKSARVKAENAVPLATTGPSTEVAKLLSNMKKAQSDVEGLRRRVYDKKMADVKNEERQLNEWFEKDSVYSHPLQEAFENYSSAKIYAAKMKAKAENEFYAIEKNRDLLKEMNVEKYKKQITGVLNRIYAGEDISIFRPYDENLDKPDMVE
eukprot:GHVT01059557.1.p1 GENE.GHVT01059557.1~~GHVT01059557.1.p1  ORF type:complete len:290 (+),score=15.61 GHVT01059557.1:366-1235(+)